MNVYDVLEPIYGDLGVPKNRATAIRVWLHSKAFRVSGLEASDIEGKVLAECHSAGEFLSIIMAEVARKQGVDRWIDSTPTNVPHMLRIRADFPDAQFIHIIRDARDVALSLDKRAWSRPLPWDKKKSLLAAGLYWEWIIRKARKIAPMLTPRYIEIRYEELVERPRETLTVIGEFIEQDLNYDQIQQAGIGSVKKPLTSFDEDLKQGRFTPVGRWKDKFPAGQLIDFEKLVGTYLQELGYTLSIDPARQKRNLSHVWMRLLYASYYECKQTVKTHTRLSRLMVDYSEILIDK